MTIDDAIKHAEEVAENNERRAESVRNRPISSADFYHEEESCSKCATEHRQLAEWLKELKQLREQTGWVFVSERMPKNNEDVLVCYEDGHVETAYYYIDADIYPSEYEDCCETGWYNCNEDFMYNQDVIAWMPLPASFEPQEGVNKE